MKRYAVCFTMFLIFILLLLGVTITAEAEPVQVLKNRWALGIDNASGCPGDIDSAWTHSATVSLSRCPKNPAPAGMTDGSAFKNGPVNGGGQPGVETLSVQTFTLPEADSYTFNFSALLICVRCDYVRVDLYAGDEYLGNLLDFSEGTTPCATDEKWARYCGDSLTVPYRAEYSLQIRSLWTQSNSLGAKWTGLELFAEAAGVAPTAVPSPTPTNVFLPLVMGDRGRVLGLGCIPVVVASGTNPDGSGWIEVECR